MRDEIDVEHGLHDHDTGSHTAGIDHVRAVSGPTRVGDSACRACSTRDARCISRARGAHDRAQVCSGACAGVFELVFYQIPLRGRGDARALGRHHRSPPQFRGNIHIMHRPHHRLS